MKLLTFLLLINSAFSYGFSLKDYEKKIKSTSSIKTVVEKLTKEEVENSLRDFIANSRPSRVVGSIGHEKSEKYIEEKFKELKSSNTIFEIHEFGPDVVSAGKLYEDDFNREILAKVSPNDPNYRKWKDFTVSMLNSLNEIKNIKGKNYIWEKKGNKNPNDIILVVANYDTLNHDPKTMKVDMKSSMPGADNNGTGVAMILSMAKIFNQLDLPKTIRLVLLDVEEFGFLGSKAYVEKLKTNPQEKILGVVNLVMLGNDSKIKDTEKKFGNMKVYLRDPAVNKEDAQKDLDFGHPLIEMGKKMYSGIEFKLAPNGMNSSSHIRFWEAGFPAICFSENWETDFNPRFHTSDDFVETINFNTFVDGFHYITSSLLAYEYDIVK